jgi:hypothetical protein
LLRWAGTTEAGFPVIVSALFDDGGLLRAIRLVTDARPEHRNDIIEPDQKKRDRAYLFGAFMASRYGIDPARGIAYRSPRPRARPRSARCSSSSPASARMRRAASKFRCGKITSASPARASTRSRPRSSRRASSKARRGSKFSPCLVRRFHNSYAASFRVRHYTS